MKGILLAGGSGTRLYPLTSCLSKHLLPVYDKPMVFYPLSVLLLAGIREILVVTTPRDANRFRELLGTGGQWGVQFSYVEQPEPKGIAQALHLAKDFLGGGPCCLVLGDNLFFGRGLGEVLREAARLTRGALIFAYPVKDPSRYGVVEFDAEGRVLSLEEKPARPRSQYAAPGLYFYDGRAAELAQTLAPSARGEYEITDLNRLYLERGELTAEPLGRGLAWLDTGSFEALHEAASFVRAVQERQGLQIACPEEIAFRMGYIDVAKLRRIAEPLRQNSYGSYLLSLADEAERELSRSFR